MDQTQKAIAGRISLLMNRLAVNQKQIAGLLGVTQPAVSKYLRDRTPPATILLKLAEMTGTSIEWILTGKESGNIPRTAEPLGSYSVAKALTLKIEQLPVAVQKGLLDLVDSLLSVQREA